MSPVWKVSANSCPRRSISRSRADAADGRARQISDISARRSPVIRVSGNMVLRHPVDPGLLVPLRRHLLRLRPELERPAAGDVADAELRLVPAAEAEGLARHGDADVHADHTGAGVLHDVAGHAAALP